MTSIESGSLSIEQPAEKLFSFLSDFNHFQQLMPPQITNWQSTSDTCSFTIQGMATLELRIVEKLPFQSIRMLAEGKTPVPVEMKWHFESPSEVSSLASLTLLTDMSPMLLMMAKGPLENFVKLLVQKLKELAESGQL
jgi:hypothetical protein